MVTGFRGQHNVRTRRYFPQSLHGQEIRAEHTGTKISLDIDREPGMNSADSGFNFENKFTASGKETVQTNLYISNFCSEAAGQTTQHQRDQPETQQIIPNNQTLGILQLFENGQIADASSSALAKVLSTLNTDKNRRARGEKKPIPDNLKDEKYFERRRRNNDAAKRSRDTRKLREDQLATRASLLERNNSILRVQILSMREEAMKLKELWLKKCQGMALSCQLQQNTPQSRTPVSGQTQQTQMVTQNQNSCSLPGR